MADGKEWWARAAYFAARLPHRWIVPALLALFSGLAVVAALRDSATSDETAHIAAGYTYLDRWDFRLNPEHPPLAKMWAALPLLLGGIRDADYESRAWRNGDEWAFGFAFLNGPPESAQRRDPGRRLIPSRLPIIALGVLLGLVVWLWARDLWGRTGALVALFLYALSPTVLAHAHLVTTDVAAALGFTVTLWCFWRFCRRPGWVRALWTGLALGMALLMKFSTLLLAPILVGLWLLWLFSPAAEAGERRRRLRLGAGALAAIALVAFVSVWAGYGFRYSTTRDDSWRPDPGAKVAKDGFVAGAISFGRSCHLLPEAYLYGLARLFGEVRRTTFINGEITNDGKWYYFPEVFLLKTTPALLLLLAWVAVAGLRRTRARSFKAWFLAAPAAAYFLMAILSGMNIGHRHLLPVYPALFLAAGAAPGLLAGLAWRRNALVVLLAAHAVSSLAACPRYLSYFNLVAGGSGGGWRCVVDSNIDWGQDLRRLKEKIDEHRIPSVYLIYFGTADPRAYGIPYRKTLMVPDLRPDEPAGQPGPGAYVAVSVTILQVLDGPAGEALRRNYAPFDKAGDSIFLYRFPGGSR